MVKMIDDGEKEAIQKRIEEWGEMILNNVQQQCLERKLSLTIYTFIFPILSIVLITFSIYKLDMISNLILTVIHLLVILIIFYIEKFDRRKKSKNKKTKDNKNNPKKEESEESKSVII